MTLPHVQQTNTKPFVFMYLNYLYPERILYILFLYKIDTRNNLAYILVVGLLKMCYSTIRFY